MWVASPKYLVKHETEKKRSSLVKEVEEIEMTVVRKTSAVEDEEIFHSAMEHIHEPQTNHAKLNPDQKIQKDPYLVTVIEECVPGRILQIRRKRTPNEELLLEQVAMNDFSGYFGQTDFLYERGRNRDPILQSPDAARPVNYFRGDKIEGPQEESCFRRFCRKLKKIALGSEEVALQAQIQKGVKEPECTHTRAYDTRLRELMSDEPDDLLALKNLNVHIFRPEDGNSTEQKLVQGLDSATDTHQTSAVRRRLQTQASESEKVRNTSVSGPRAGHDRDVQGILSGLQQFARSGSLETEKEQIVPGHRTHSLAALPCTLFGPTQESIKRTNDKHFSNAETRLVDRAMSMSTDRQSGQPVANTDRRASRVKGDTAGSQEWTQQPKKTQNRGAENFGGEDIDVDDPGQKQTLYDKIQEEIETQEREWYGVWIGKEELRFMHSTPETETDHMQVSYETALRSIFMSHLDTTENT